MKCGMLFHLQVHLCLCFFCPQFQSYSSLSL